jgi:acetoin utilization deacetylase AcuC-like enzyme
MVPAVPEAHPPDTATVGAVKVVASDDHRLHVPPYEVLGGQAHPPYERPERAEAVAAALSTAGFELTPPTEHGEGLLLAVHTPDLLRHLATAWHDWTAAGNQGPLVPDTFDLGALLDGPRAISADIEHRVGRFCFDTSSPMLEGTYPAARASADVALTAADLVADGEPAAFALCRPPGHHAGRRFYGGYCFFNNSAVAAARLRDRLGRRVALLDLDYHHGNGTQQIFWDDPDVLTVSVHADPAVDYPFYTGYAEETGGPGALGSNLNLPLPKGSGHGKYLDAMTLGLETVAAFDPAALVVPFGADTAAEDPMGTFTLAPATYALIGGLLAGWPGPRLVVMEGGYHPPALARAVVEVLTALDEGRDRR